jgi:hypothetical protein
MNCFLAQRDPHFSPQVRSQFVKLAAAADAIFRMRPYLQMLRTPVSMRDEVLRRHVRAASFLSAGRRQSAVSSQSPVHVSDATATPTATPAPTELLEKMIENLPHLQVKHAEDEVRSHQRLSAVLLPDLRELQQRTLVRARALLAEGASPSAIQAVVNECKPFFEQFRVAQVLLVSPHTAGLTVVLKSGTSTS